MNALQDHNGKPSTGRWLALLAMLTAIGLAANHATLAWAGKESDDLTLVLYFLLASMGGKLGQKIIEMRVVSKDEEG